MPSSSTALLYNCCMAQPAQPGILFHESQRFTQWWLWLLTAASVAPLWWGFFEQIIFGRPFGDRPMPDLMLVAFTLAFGLGIPLLLYACRLEISVRTDALYVRFVPFHSRQQRIEYSSITSVTPGKYNPIRDYGGWGLKMGRGGTVYNVSGNLGVRLELMSGKHLMLGTQQPLELAQALTQAIQAAQG